MVSRKYDDMLRVLKESRAYSEDIIMGELRRLLTAKSQFKMVGPVIFVCTRIGEVGSALFKNTQDLDEQDVTLSEGEARHIVDRVHALGLYSVAESERRKRMMIPVEETPEEDLRNYITASSRKYVIVSVDKGENWLHCRCVSSLKHKGGMVISHVDKFVLVCLYESPMSASDAVNLSIEIETKVKKMGV